jgi:hypothetical protein
MKEQYLGFPISDELYQRVVDLGEKVSAAENKRPYAIPIFEVVRDLSDAGVRYFFIESLQRANSGRLKVMAVENAIGIGKRAILGIGKQVLKGMSSEQIGTMMEMMTESLLTRENGIKTKKDEDDKTMG